MSYDVEAAGGVVWRLTGKGRRKFLLVHRRHHQDWSFPKGKLDPGEKHKEAALREVEEETGLRCTAGDKLDSVTYTVSRGRSKRVKYWLMTRRNGKFVANSEVDKVAWLTAKQARRKLTYDLDRSVLADAIEHLNASS